MKSIIFSIILSLFVWNLSSNTDASDTVSILCVNIRQSKADDKENAWLKRRDFLAEVVRDVPYDIIGMQEVIVDAPENVNQLGFFAQKLPEYGFLSRGRGKNPDGGEAVPVFYRKDRWEIDRDEQGFFWLSDTSEIPGSITWKGQSGCPRNVTWALLHGKDEKTGKRTGKSIYVFNTHFDHEGEIARQKSAVLILNKIAERRNKDVPVVLTGDFNTGENNKAVRLLKGEEVEIDGENIKPPLTLIDSFRLLYPDETDVCTFNSFRGPKPGGAKIDYIFVTPDLETVESRIIRTKNEAGRYPSDHFPIDAVLRWKKK